MSFVRSVALTTLTKFVVIAVGMVSSIITARFLGPHDKGILAAITALVGIVIQFGNLGLPNATTYYVASQRTLLPRLIANSVGSAAIFGVGMSLIAYVAALMYPRLIGDAPRTLLVVGLLGVPWMFFTLLAQNLLVGLGNIRAYNLLDLVGNGLAVTTTLVVILIFHGGVRGLVYAGTAVAVVTAALFFIALKETSVSAIDLSLFRKMFTYGVRSYLANLASYLVIRSDLLLVTIFLGTTATGIYSVAAFAVDLVYLISTVTGTIFFPLATAQAGERNELTAKVVRTLVLVMVPLAALGSLAAIYGIPLLYGPSYAGAVTPTLVLLIGIVFLSLETILMNYFASRGLPFQAVLIIIIGLVVNVGANLFIIPRFGITGAAVTSTVAYGVMLIGALIYFVRATALPWQVVIIPTKKDGIHLVGQLKHLVRSRLQIAG